MLVLIFNRDDRDWQVREGLVLGDMEGKKVMLGRRSYGLTVADDVDDFL